MSTTADPEPLVALRGVARRYRVPGDRWWRRTWRTALHDVDLTISGGRHTAVIGESGSGKSTLLRLVLGLERPDAGQLLVRGAPITSATLTGLRRAVQLVAQDPGSSLDPRCTVGESIREPLECLDVPGDHGRRVGEALTMVGLDPAAADRRPAEFSGGERQRIALARALAPRPQVLLGDEPFGAVDPSTRTRLVALVRDVVARDGTQLVLVSHDLGVVERLCDDVVVLEAGRVAETGPVAEVFARPRSRAAHGLLEAVPRLPDRDSEPDSDRAGHADHEAGVVG